METLDLSDIFARMAALSADDNKVKAKAAELKNYANWNGVPDAAFEKLAKLGVVFDTVIRRVRHGRGGHPLLGGDCKRNSMFRLACC